MGRGASGELKTLNVTKKSERAKPLDLVFLPLLRFSAAC